MVFDFYDFLVKNQLISRPSEGVGQKQKWWSQNELPVNTVIDEDILEHLRHYIIYSSCQGLHNSHQRFLQIRWAHEAVASTSSEFDHVSTMSPYVESGGLSISTSRSPTFDLKSVLQSSWSIDFERHWEFSGSWAEIFHIFEETMMRTLTLSSPSTPQMRAFLNILSHEPENSQWRSKSILQELCNTLFRSNVGDHEVEILKPPLST
jgi:hypothetical protein